jgi:hypothetical protein
MRPNGNAYEYIAVYVDDLAIVARDPKGICDLLMTKYLYKLKGVEAIKYHLGCDFGRDSDGIMTLGPKRYVERALKQYESLFGVPPTPYRSPLEKNDHPELDESPFVSDDDCAKYATCIGVLQWIISLGRFDIATAVMTMSRFRAQPRQGHMTRVRHIYGYLKKFPGGSIRVRTGMPDYSDLDSHDYDWESTVYGKVKEEIPSDMPAPLGKQVTTTSYVDANLYHDYVTGRAVTGVLHFVNGMPVEWFTKRQATVETATYGSEFVAARIATEQIIDLRTTLRYLGVPIATRSFMFGDNKSVVTSSTIPHSVLNKRHNALSYHRVREAIAAKILAFVHIEGSKNPADILSKHYGHAQVWHMVRALLFCGIDPMDLDNKSVRIAPEGSDRA